MDFLQQSPKDKSDTGKVGPGDGPDLTSLVFAVLATALVVAVIALPLIMALSPNGGVPNLVLSLCSFSGPMPTALPVR